MSRRVSTVLRNEICCLLTWYDTRLAEWLIGFYEIIWGICVMIPSTLNHPIYSHYSDLVHRAIPTAVPIGIVWGLPPTVLGIARIITLLGYWPIPRKVISALAASFWVLVAFSMWELVHHLNTGTVNYALICVFNIFLGVRSGTINRRWL